MPTLPSQQRPVTDVAAAPPERALAHFSALLELETDCYDVNLALSAGHGGFVVLDVRPPQYFAAGHVPGSVNIPHARIHEKALEAYPADTLFVVYCAGPHCNGADRAAIRLARLGRPVKKMIGGITGWIADGLALERGTDPSA